MPVQPLYEAIEMDAAELLQIVRKLNPATVLSRQIQHAEEIWYEMLWPVQFTEDWVRAHVRKVYMDDHNSQSSPRNSVTGDVPAAKLSKLRSYQPANRIFYGYELRVPVRKIDSEVYQDGSTSKGLSVKLYHSTRRGLLHNILKVGVQASILTHATEGLWTFAIPSVAGYEWGRTGLETTLGTILDLRAPLTIWDGYTGAF